MFSSHPALPALLLHGPLSRRSPARGCPVPALRGWEVSGAHGRNKKFPWSGTSGGLPFCIRREDHAGHRRANSRSCASTPFAPSAPPTDNQRSGEEIAARLGRTNRQVLFSFFRSLRQALLGPVRCARALHLPRPCRL